MKLLVLAGGFGKRLLSAVPLLPKAMAPVGNDNLLQLQIDHWTVQGISSYVFLLHHQADMIIKFLREISHERYPDHRLEWLVEPAPMGTGGAVAYAVEHLNITGRFLLTNADTWLGTGIRELAHVDASAMAVVKQHNASRYGGVRFDENNTITNFEEKPSNEQAIWINAGLYCLDASIFHDWDHKPLSLERSVFPNLVERGHLKAVPITGDFVDIGIPSDYSRFCQWIASGRQGALCN